MSNATREVTTQSLVTFDGFNEGEFQKAGTKTAQLRQSITTLAYYPSKKVANELNGSLFSPSDFGFEEQVFSSVENRVAWVFVPIAMDEATLAGFIAKANSNGANIYRVLSSAPIISKDQQWSIDNGRKTLDDYANSQVMRYPEGSAKAGQLIMNGTRVMYRKTFFSGIEGPKADVDMRNSTDEYRSAAVIAELGSDKVPF